MPDNPNDNNKRGIPRRLQNFIEKARSKGKSLTPRGDGVKRWGTSLRNRIPKTLQFDPRKIEIRGVEEHSAWIRWGIVVVAVFLLAEVASRTIGLFIRPVYLPPPKKNASAAQTNYIAGAEYDSLTRRNMFNVEGKIPDPFDQGLLDCFSQAKATTQRLILLGTIVMGDDFHSVALIQEEGNGVKLAVKKDESFADGKYTALKVERKKLCFQVRATQELEFIEIPDDSHGLGLTATLGGSEGIVPTSDNSYMVKKTYLDEKLLNLNDILQTAKAVPYLEPGSGRFVGFLVQGVDPSSPFAQLGVRQGDILTTVNDIVLDNPGKGLEAFQKLRNSPKVSLGVIRGGEKQMLSYDIK